MNARELKDKYISFFVSKGHKEIPSSSLTPENDPTTLFISAGMQQLVPYFIGMSHPLGKKVTDVQKCVRTGDIDEVGDAFHHTFFEMLGNWSLGDYFKKEAIEWSFEFLTKVLEINPQNLFVTCFAGNKDAPKDEFSASIWQSLGMSQSQIIFLEDNWWGPAGTTGPCGPDSEMFIDTNPELPKIDFKTGDKQGRYLEIWNDVFLEFNKDIENNFTKLAQQNVDTGMGVERTLAILSGFSDNYMTSIWQPIIGNIEEITKLKYGEKSDNEYINEGNQCWVDTRKSMRIIADHIRSAVFIIADGVEPSNKEAGYVLRRLIRRSIRQGKILGIENNFIKEIAIAVLDNQNNYAGIYPELNQNKEKILSILENEENKFRKTLNNGLRELEKIINKLKQTKDFPSKISNQELGSTAFYCYESFGFPYEMSLEEFKNYGIIYDLDEVTKSFDSSKELKRELSQTLSAGKFKSGLADNSEIITKYHTATHLLHAGLRKFLGENVHQSGSNITSERLRFDFNYDQKLTDEQLKEIGNFVNDQIKKSLSVICETMKFTDAVERGALAFFGSKYPETVTVYTIGDIKDFVSKEVCTGPHVSNTKELGIFEITKEESAGAGKRRIYAILK